MDTRQQKIIELRNVNWAWSAIGNYFGISRARAHQIGSGYNNWKIKEYQEVILDRDNYTCQWKKLCDGSKKDLVIHHIDFNDRNNDFQNLITLCHSCHRYFHSKFHVDRDKEEMLRNRHHTTTKLFRVNCKNCGKELELVKSHIEKGSFCNSKCRQGYKDKKWTKICAGCGKEFVIRRTTRYNYYRNKNKFKRKSYCGRECFRDSTKKS